MSGVAEAVCSHAFGVRRSVFDVRCSSPAKRSRAATGVLAALVLLLTVGCATSGKKNAEPADPDFRRADGLARTAYLAGDYARAAPLFAEALARAEAMDEPALAGYAAYNLAVTADRTGRYDDAERHVQRALDELTRAGQPLDEAALLQVAILHRAGKLKEAAGQITRYLDADAVKKRPAAFEAELLVRRALLAAARKDPAVAEQALARVKKMKPLSFSRPLQALYAQAEGASRLLADDTAAARVAFEREALLRKAARQYAPMAEAYLRAAACVDDDTEATKAYLRVARIWVGQGQAEKAEAAARKALRLAKKEKRVDLREQAEALLASGE